MTLIATDLDRTMIFSRNAIGADFADENLLCVEHYNGGPLSYMTLTAVAQLRELAAQSIVVPTTTRTIEQFNRIELPGAPWRYAITSNGGNILVDGVADPVWRSSVGAATHDGGADLDEVVAALQSRISDDWVDTCRVADDLFCYLVVRLDAVPAGFLAEWGQWCSERGWNVSQQGRKIYMMPSTVCKSRAVAEVHKRMIASGDLPDGASILAAGDGALDAEMLIAADAAIRPRHGELEMLQWTHPTVRVTVSSGIVAGEEILRWFDAQRLVEPVPAKG